MEVLESRYEEMRRMTIPKGYTEKQRLHWYQNYCCRADNLCADLVVEVERLQAEPSDLFYQLQAENQSLTSLCANYKEALESIVADGDFTAPEGMKRIAKAALQAEKERDIAIEGRGL